jgi:hypothetical protein
VDKSDTDLPRRVLINDLDWIVRIIKNLQKDKFYGNVSVSFVNGKIRRVDKKEQIVPPSSEN